MNQISSNVATSFTQDILSYFDIGMWQYDKATAKVVLNDIAVRMFQLVNEDERFHKGKREFSIASFPNMSMFFENITQISQEILRGQFIFPKPETPGVLIKCHWVWESKPNLLSGLFEENHITDLFDYQMLLAESNLIIAHLNHDGICLRINQYGFKFFGFSQDEILNRHITETILPVRDTKGEELWPLIAAFIAEEGDTSITVVNQNVKKNGERVWIQWHSHRRFNSQTGRNEIIGIGIDVTNQQKKQHSLTNHYQREQRALIFNQIIKNDFDEKLWNKSVKIFGWKIPDTYCCAYLPTPHQQAYKRESSLTSFLVYTDPLQALTNDLIDWIKDNTNAMPWQTPHGIGIILPVILENQYDEDYQVVNKFVVKLETYLPEESIFVGVSSISNHVKNLPQLYKQARQALNVGYDFHLNEHIFCWSRQEVFNALTEESRKLLGPEFSQRYIGKLKEYDQQNKTDFFATLNLIIHASSLTKVAEAMNIHRKTVVYRKRRIEEILGLSLDDPMTKLNVFVAISLSKKEQIG